MHFTRIPSGYRFNMCFQLLFNVSRSLRAAVIPLKEPLRGLIMPDQRMAHNKQVILSSEFHESVGPRKIIDPGCRINSLRLHFIFRRNAAELAENNTPGGRIFPRYDLIIHGGSHFEGAGIPIPQ
ncbi:hypothetical protein FQZ97_1014400 [compost metagenome]